MERKNVNHRVRMRAYIVPTGGTISPFGDPPGKVRVLNMHLEQYQRRVLARLRIGAETAGDPESIDDRGFLLIQDNVFFTRSALRRFLRGVRGKTNPCVLALPDCSFAREKRPLQDDLIVEKGPDGKDRYVFGIYYCPEPAPLEELRKNAERIVIEVREKVVEPENVKILGDEASRTLDISYAFTPQAVQHVCHWTHITDIHLEALVDFWVDFRPGRILWLLWKVLMAFSFNKWKIAQRIVIKGKNCDIHPSATVEGCVLGDNVTVGANSFLRGSVVADNVKVGNTSNVIYSAVGTNAIVVSRAGINFAVLYPRAMISQPGGQICVVGERALMLVGIFPLDMKLDMAGGRKGVKVLHHGEVVPSGKTFLGPCIGHGSILGSGLWLNHGLEVPNNTILVKDVLEVVRRFPADLEPMSPAVLRDGKVINLFTKPEGETKAPEGEKSS